MWFSVYQAEVLNDPKVLDENVYNMDESGFSIGTIKAGRVVVDSQIHSKYRAQPG